jgi:ribosomal protein L29
MAKKYTEIAKLGEKELTQRAIELKQELAKEKGIVASGTRSEKPGKIKALRREIARIFTAMNSKKKEAMN